MAGPFLWARDWHRGLSVLETLWGGLAQFVQQGAALITNQKTRGVVSLGPQQSEKYRCLMLEGYK